MLNKKAFLVSLTAVAATIAVGVGGTLALFSDSKSTSTTLAAGYLCIDSDRDALDNVRGPMFYMTAAQGITDQGELGEYPLGEVSPTSPPLYVPPTPGGWAPGDSVTRTLTVYNGSPATPPPGIVNNPPQCPRSMSAKLTHITAQLHGGSYAPLADKMKVTVRAQQPGGGMVQVAQAYLNQFLTPGGVALQYPSGANPQMPAWNGGFARPQLQMDFQVDFDLDTPNAYQDKTMIVDFTVYAEQLAHNP